MRRPGPTPSPASSWRPKVRSVAAAPMSKRRSATVTRARSRVESMHQSRRSRFVLLPAIALLVAACSAPTSRTADTSAAKPGTPVTLLAFGDGGYHYDHLEKEVYEKVVSAEQFMAKERKD